jgi:hypothetical protein
MNYMRRLNSREASAYLFEVHGIRRSPATLAKLRVVGGGPIFSKTGRTPTYQPPHLDDYAEQITSRPVRSTSELRDLA